METENQLHVSKQTHIPPQTLTTLDFQKISHRVIWIHISTFQMIHLDMISAFADCHTRLIGTAQHDYHPNNSRKITPENNLKNIWKLSENWQLAAQTNTVFVSLRY